MTADAFGKVWRSELVDVITSCLGRAESGGLVVLEVTGTPGSGKSSLLAELIVRADGFRVASAECLEFDRTPYGVLEQWDDPVPTGLGDRQPTVVMAARTVREFIDSFDGPLLLTIDDLQWADPESVESILWILRRSTGQRLLLAVATRPLDADVLPDWQRWLSDYADATRVTMTGLDEHDAAEFVRTYLPGANDATVSRLWRHTGGNPLYLKSLIRDYTTRDFAALRLPAPTEFLRTVTAMLQGASDTAVALIRALAVLNSGWVSMRLAAEIATVAEPEPACDELRDRGMIEFRDLDESLTIRTAHSLIGSALYQLMPLSMRRTLHLRAADLVESVGASLQHRVAGASRYDEELAGDLQAHAAALYTRRSFRLASQYQMWASDQTGPREARDQRWLLGQYYRIKAGDLTAVDQHLEAIREKGNGPLQAFVLGFLAISERRWHEGISVIEPWTRMDVEAFDPLLRHRMEIVLAWARMCADQPTEVIAEGLARAAQTGQEDLALEGMETTLRGVVDIRRSGPVAALHGISAAIPELPVETPERLVTLLAARGALRALNGVGGPALDDLSESVRRGSAFEVAQEIPSLHIYLGLAHWLNGEWSRAQVSLHTAADLHPEHPMAMAFRPLVDSCEGRFSDASLGIRHAEHALDEWPWREAAMYLFIVRVVYAHALDENSEKTRLLESVGWQERDRIPFLSSFGSLVLMCAGQAAVWAGDADYADGCVDGLSAFPFPWVEPARAWLGGLVEELRGNAHRAYSLVTTASNSTEFMRFYRAHTLVDAARLAEVVHQPGAERMLERAALIYKELGATPYLSRIARTRSQPAVAVPTVSLSDRERDILTLLVQGMSYAQIADELFITQKTVSYHLGRLYVKAGVRSRHELTRLAHTMPQMFEPA